APTAMASVRRLRLETAGGIMEPAPTARAARTARIGGTSDPATTSTLVARASAMDPATTARQMIRLAKASSLSLLYPSPRRARGAVHLSGSLQRPLQGVDHLRIEAARAVGSQLLECLLLAHYLSINAGGHGGPRLAGDFMQQD